MIYMEKYLAIAKEHLKFNICPHMLAALLMLILSPFLMGTRNLTSMETAKVLETYAALLGIVLLPPMFWPEQNRDVRDLIRSKFVDIRVVYAVRLIINISAMALFLLIYIQILIHGQCRFDAGRYYVGTLAEMLALGGLGAICYSLSDNLVIGYMAPVIYYIAAWGGGIKYMGIFYPFSMMAGKSEYKWALMAAGIVFLVCAVWMRGREGHRFH